MYENEQERLIKANATLVSYMRSMGDLAADDLTNFDKGIGAFGSALADAELFSPAESSAIANLASYLARMAADGYRRKQLRDVIKEANADVATATAALARIVSKNYILQLENERVAMREYYRKLTVESVRFSRLAVAHADGETDVTNPVPLDDLEPSSRRGTPRSTPGPPAQRRTPRCWRRWRQVIRNCSTMPTS